MDDLRAMAVRLARSRSALEEALIDLQAEQRELLTENSNTRSTIELMLGEVAKLNINSGNLNEPELEEGPLDFVGRFWEKVRPRDSAVSVSDRVGEIKRPSPTSVSTSPPSTEQHMRSMMGHLETMRLDYEQRFAEFSDMANQTSAESLGKQVSERFSNAMNLLTEKASSWQESAGSTDVPPATAAPLSFGSLFTYLGSPGQKPATGVSSAGPDGPDLPEEGSPADAVQAPACFNREQLPESPRIESAASVNGAGTAEAESQGSEERVANGHPAPESPPSPGDSSTVLIQARLRLDDGSVAVCRVRAADRCIDVASRFINEHSLKQRFEAPLKEFLMKAESGADTFPVELEGDLMEIYQQHSTKGS